MEFSEIEKCNNNSLLIESKITTKDGKEFIVLDIMAKDNEGTIGRFFTGALKSYGDNTTLIEKLNIKFK